MLFGDPHGNFQNAGASRIPGLLGEIAHHAIFIEFNGALISILFLQDYLEESRLTRPVRPHQRDSLAPVDGHLRVFEQHAATEGLGHFLDRQHGGVDVGADRPRVKKFAVNSPRDSKTEKGLFLDRLNPGLQ